MKGAPRVLQLAAVGTTVRFLLLPLIERLAGEGFHVCAACANGEHAQETRNAGVQVHAVPMARRVVSWTHVRSLTALVRLMRNERFDLVHVHTPVAAVLGRMAARIAGVPLILYTAHGFYFHDRMTCWKRRILILLERRLGRCCTDLLFTQSREDRETAVREAIMPAARAVWIGNGVEVERFESPASAVLRDDLGLEPEDFVVGFAGRLVAEKGVWELLDALALLAPRYPHLKLLVVGDRLHSDRDRRTGKSLPETVAAYGLDRRVIFTGFQAETPPYYALMDLFVLPSYREGMPRTILEAMAAGKPVVATNIRGCREEVVHKETGLLVPVGDAETLADAIEQILTDARLAETMGRRGRERARDCFREETVLDRQVTAIKALLADVGTDGDEEGCDG